MTTDRLQPLDFADDESYQRTQSLVDQLVSSNQALRDRLAATRRHYDEALAKLCEQQYAVLVPINVYDGQVDRQERLRETETGPAGEGRGDAEDSFPAG